MEKERPLLHKKKESQISCNAKNQVAYNEVNNLLEKLNPLMHILPSISLYYSLPSPKVFSNIKPS